MKNKKVLHWLFLITAAVFFAALTVQIHNADERLYGPNENQQSSVANQVLDKAYTLTNRDGGSEVEQNGIITPVSCYTAIESHGKNGRNSWSVATWKYPQGTKLFIEGIGEKIVETVTAEKYRDRIDVWFGDDYESCIKFGVQNLKVLVIK